MSEISSNDNGMQIKSPKDLIVYQKAYALAMEIFEVSKSFLRKKNTRLPIESGVLLDRFVQICERRGQSESTKPISSASLLMPTERMVRLTLG